jgi:tRNA threonylcarbamoyladenosine biosynthesis protein TsaB
LVIRLDSATIELITTRRRAPGSNPHSTEVRRVNILVLDTSAPRAILAVTTTRDAVHERTNDPSVRHGRNLIPGIRDLLDEAGLAPRDLGLIGVGLGPGSSTGLRIGLTAAKTFAYAMSIPLVGFESFDAIARNAPIDATCVSVIADAQRGDLYTAEFAREYPGGPLVRHTSTRVEHAARWLDHLGDDTFILGPGLERLAPRLPESVRSAGPEASSPQGAHLIALARELSTRGEFADPWFLEPLYLRPSAAEEQWDRTAGSRR